MVKVADNRTDSRRGIDHIGVTASFVIHDGNGNVLMQKRGQHARDERGMWDTGGGAVEFGEKVEDALVREIQEEYLTKPLSMSFIAVNDVHREHEGAKTHWISLIYEVKVDPKTIKIGEPHKVDEIGWFAPDNLPSPLHSQVHKAIAAVQKAKFLL